MLDDITVLLSKCLIITLMREYLFTGIMSLQLLLRQELGSEVDIQTLSQLLPREIAQLAPWLSAAIFPFLISYTSPHQLVWVCLSVCVLCVCVCVSVCVCAVPAGRVSSSGGGGGVWPGAQ